MARFNLENLRRFLILLLIYWETASVFSLSVYNEKSKYFEINSDHLEDPLESLDHHRYRRDAKLDNVHVKVKNTHHRYSLYSNPPNKSILQVNKMNDSHQQLIVHWVGEEANINTNVIICLARNPKESSRNVPSAVYYSYDYGETYVNKTQYFKINATSYALLDKYYIHPRYISHVSIFFIQLPYVFVYISL